MNNYIHLYNHQNSYESGDGIILTFVSEKIAHNFCRVYQYSAKRQDPDVGYLFGGGLVITNWPNSQIPECIYSISHNAPFRTEMCTWMHNGALLEMEQVHSGICTFMFWMEHCGIWNRCILGFVKLVYKNTAIFRVILSAIYYFFWWRTYASLIMFDDACLRRRNGPWLIWIMTCRLADVRLLFYAMLCFQCMQHDIQCPFVPNCHVPLHKHCNDVTMGAMASQSSDSRFFTQTFIQTQMRKNIKAPRHWPLCGGIHWWPVNSPHKWPVARKLFPFDDVIMNYHEITICHVIVDTCKHKLIKASAYTWKIKK